jgi:hypothetical protein
LELGGEEEKNFSGGEERRLGWYEVGGGLGSFI